MKTKTLLCIVMEGLFLPMVMTAQTSGIKADAAIRQVTVYTSGARVFCEKKVEIPSGQTTILFTGISSELDPGSIQVSAGGPVTILTVNHELDFLTDPEQNAEIKKLEKQRDNLLKKAGKEKMQMEILDKEEQFLQANMKVTGTQSGTKVAELAQVYDYFVSKSTEIAAGKAWRNDSIRSWNEHINRINKQIGDLQAEHQKPAGVIVVRVDAMEKTTVPFRISYVTPAAGWFPSYDIRVTSIESPVVLSYKANVFQRTGVEWKDVTLRFSSASAFRTGILPELTPWWLDFQVQGPVRFRESGKLMDANYMKKAETFDAVMESTAAIPLGMTAMEQLTTVEFQMEKPLSVPASGKNMLVDIQEVTLPADYSYISVPKLDPAAHLKAKLRGWEPYNLMAGEANIYFEGAFTGKTFLNTADFSDTLEISLGVDPGISIQRNLEKEHSSTRFLSSKTEVTKSWKLTLRNNKSQKINITVLDQVPLSANSDIEITGKELSGGNQDLTTGQVTWEITVKPSEKAEKRLSYTIRYPKGKKINID